MAALSWRLLIPGWRVRLVPLRLAGRVIEWQERARQRAMLARLDDHLLRDLGLTRAEALREYGKPFWRV
jgi:uncharacterized protein YjiS (DUF1127 family)